MGCKSYCCINTLTTFLYVSSIILATLAGVMRIYDNIFKLRDVLLVMSENTMTYISSGKAKDIYETLDGNLLFEFTDRVTAFDGEKKAEYQEKGEITCRVAEYWFNILEQEGIPTHYISCPTPTSMLVKRLKIVPLEVICRNYAAGSLLRRYESGEVELPDGVEPKEGAPIPGGMIEFTTKFEAVDRPVDIKEILFNGWLGEKEIEYITKLTKRINEILGRELNNMGIILADFKIEYGKTPEGEIILADEAGTPDGCRFWDKTEFENGVIKSLDKDVFRKGTGDLTAVYGELFERIQKSRVLNTT